MMDMALKGFGGQINQLLLSANREREREIEKTHPYWQSVRAEFLITIAHFLRGDQFRGFAGSAGPSQSTVYSSSSSSDVKPVTFAVSSTFAAFSQSWLDASRSVVAS